MEVRSTPQGSPEDRSAERLLGLSRGKRDAGQSSIERSEQAKEARNRELKAESERAERRQEVARRVGEVVRDGMLKRVSGTGGAADRVELSTTGLAAAGALETSEGTNRAAHVAVLKAALEAGELFSRERLERAADRLLGAEVQV